MNNVKIGTILCALAGVGRSACRRGTHLLTASLALLAFHGLTEQGEAQGIRNATTTETYDKPVQAGTPSWWFCGVELKTGDSAIISASGQWLVNPDYGWWDAAGENADTHAGDRSMAPGLRPGCLLIRIGESGPIIPVTRGADGQPASVTIDRPGKIYFVANDEPPNHDGTRIAGMGNGYHWGHKGFDDNQGALNVNIVVTRVVPLIVQPQ